MNAAAAPSTPHKCGATAAASSCDSSAMPLCAQAAARPPTVLQNVQGTKTIKMTALNKAQAAAPSPTA